MFLSSCGDDSNFTVNQDDCSSFNIVSKDGASISVARDTAWSVVSADGKTVCPADAHKIAAFFNVLRDIQVMGMSQKSPDDVFDCEIIVRNGSGREVKRLRFSNVPGSPNMIGSADGGKCYIVGVPGLNQSPIVDFSSQVEYWKDRSLLYFSADNISRISVENLKDPRQSFFVATSADGYSVQDDGGNALDISSTAVRKWLGGISGVYRAADYADGLNLNDDDAIYRLAVKNCLGIEETIIFYRKFLPDGKPDFNQMYFRKGADIGTAKYYDFDKVLVDVDRLR